MTKIDKFLFFMPIPIIGMLYIYYRAINPVKSPYSWFTHIVMGFIQGYVTAMLYSYLKYGIIL